MAEPPREIPPPPPKGYVPPPENQAKVPWWHLHWWRCKTVREVRHYRYQECSCGKRRVVGYPHVNAPVDHEWLAGGEWGMDRTKKPPQGGSGTAPFAEGVSKGGTREPPTVSRPPGLPVGHRHAGFIRDELPSSCTAYVHQDPKDHLLPGDRVVLQGIFIVEQAGPGRRMILQSCGEVGLTTG